MRICYVGARPLLRHRPRRVEPSGCRLDWHRKCLGRRVDNGGGDSPDSSGVHRGLGGKWDYDGTSDSSGRKRVVGLCLLLRARVPRQESIFVQRG